MSDPMNMRCTQCGEKFRRAFLLALMIECGAETSDPNYCPESEDHEHDWKAPEEAPPVSEESEVQP